MMERLTKRANNGMAYLVKVNDDEQVVESPYQNTLKAIIESLNRLADYEDIGLTPTQLLEIDKLYLEKCEEVNRLKECFNAMKELQQNTLSSFTGELLKNKDFAEEVERLKSKLETSNHNYELYCDLQDENERLKAELEQYKPKPHVIDETCCKMRGCNKCDAYRKECERLKSEM